MQNISDSSGNQTISNTGLTNTNTTLPINTEPSPMYTSTTWQNENYSSSETVNHTKPWLIIFSILLLLGLGVAGLFLYLKPKWILANAIANTVNAESMQIELKAPLSQGMNLKVSTDYFANDSTFAKSVAILTFPTSTEKVSQFSLNSINNNRYSYLKPSHTHMNELYTLMLTNSPNLKADSSFNAIEPVLHGDAWLLDEFTEPETQEDTALLSPPQIMGGLIFGTTLNKSSELMIDGKNYTELVLGLNKTSVNEFFDQLSESQLNLSVAELNRLKTAVSNSTHLSDNIIKILVTKETNTIHSVEVTLPQELIAELNQGHTDNDIDRNPLVFVVENPTAIIDWFESNSSGPHLSIVFSNINTATAATLPKEIINVSSLEDKTVIGYVLQYISNPKIIMTATGTGNAFITATHETKLLFDKGEYQAGLEKANAALAIAKTDEDKSVAYYWIGLHTHKLGRSNEAEPILLKAASLQEKYAGPYVTLGAISLERGNYQKMLEYSQTCAAYDPNYAWCYNNMGIALISMGQADQGIVAMQKAVSLDPNSFVFNDNLKRAKGN